MQRGRRLAFDYGDVRIGVAVSDADSILCSPLTTLKRSDKRLWKNIEEILIDIEPIKIFVGRPTLLSGVDGKSSAKAEDFLNELRKITQIPIDSVDERMSTVTAARALRESGISAKNSKERIDMAAAVAILEFALILEKGNS